MLCITSVFAHPGRTDENGGHTNHSTGEYHFHHGYPAHQHSDTNGDGILDCPYSYSNNTTNTNKSSSSATRSAPDNSYSSSGSTFATKPTELKVDNSLSASTNKLDDSNSKLAITVADTNAEFVILVIGSGIVLSLFLSAQAKSIRDKYSRNAFSETSLNQEQESQNRIIEIDKENREEGLMAQPNAEQLNKEHLDNQVILCEEKISIIYEYKEYSIKSSHKKESCVTSVLNMVGAPEGAYVDSSGMPHMMDASGSDMYILYLSSTKKYHTKQCRYAYGCAPINMRKIQQNRYKYMPCALCTPFLFDTDWVDRYQKLIKD